MTAMTVSTVTRTAMTTATMSDDAALVRDALVSAGLNWTVGTEDLVLASDTARCDSLAECRAVPGRAMVRRDTGAILGVVGMDYTPVDNWDKLEVAAPWLRAGGRVVRAGALRGGRKVYMEIDMRVAGEVVKGDIVAHRIMIASSHDGSMSLRIQDAWLRLVCLNGATSMDTGTSVSLRHTTSVHERLARVGDAMQLVQGRAQAALGQWRQLAARRMSVSETREYFKAVFAQRATVQAIGTDAGERVAQRVLELVESGRGSNTYGVRGTAWGAYNAVTEYLTHERGTDADRRMDSLMFGNGAALNRKALELALTLSR